MEDILEGVLLMVPDIVRVLMEFGFVSVNGIGCIFEKPY